MIEKELKDAGYEEISDEDELKQRLSDLGHYYIYYKSAIHRAKINPGGIVHVEHPFCNIFKKAPPMALITFTNGRWFMKR